MRSMWYRLKVPIATLAILLLLDGVWRFGVKYLYSVVVIMILIMIHLIENLIHFCHVGIIESKINCFFF